jgi:Holliday junction resolvase RusA-like endonuclease
MRWDELVPEKVAKGKNFSEQLRLFARYCQQTVGTPVPQTEKWPALAKRVKVFFIEYPQADWYTLCRVAQWCRTHNVRPRTTVGLVSCFNSAWKDGAIPELDPHSWDIEVEHRIERALQMEKDEDWRSRLFLAKGPEARRRAIEEWEEFSALSASTELSESTESSASSTTSGSTKKKSPKSANPSLLNDDVIVLDLGFPPERPLSTNESNRMHWAQRDRRLEPWRKAAWALAQQQKIPEQVGGRKSKVTMVIPFRTKTKRDPHNYVGTVVKATVDGLVQAGVWPDDNPVYVEVMEPMLVIGNKNAEVQIELVDKEEG